jgi:hypothetical protein
MRRAQIYRHDGGRDISPRDIEDRKRLHQRAVAVEQRRTTIPIERPIGCVELVALE